MNEAAEIKILVDRYNESLSPNWWDGIFYVIPAEVATRGTLLFEDVGETTYYSEEALALFVGKEEKWGNLLFFSELKNGKYTKYPAFCLVEDGQNKRSFYPRNKIDLFADPTGYSAVMQDDCIISYSPLMLRPFQGQTGYCIGGLRLIDFIGKQSRPEVSVITQEVLCDKVRWQDLVRFAKPYNDYFAAAGVDKAESKEFIFLGSKFTAVPLYIGKNCVAVKCYNSEEVFYVSYQVYAEVFLQ